MISFPNKQAPKLNEVSEELLKIYTMNGTIPIYDWYINETESSTINWTDEVVDDFLSRFTKENIISGKHGRESYNDGSLMHVKAFEKYKITGKKIAVIGSLTPWIEAIAINFGNTDVTTVEYNVPICNKIKTISYDDFVNSSEKYDVILSYSSIEHSGLGRYGDPLDPEGDLKTMSEIHRHLKEYGLLLLGVPIGKDCITWNAHRVYGKKRFELLFKDFIELEWIGYDKSFLDNCGPSNNGPQPIIILTPN